MSCYYIFPMSISFMLNVDFKKWRCCPVKFRIKSSIVEHPPLLPTPGGHTSVQTAHMGAPLSLLGNFPSWRGHVKIASVWGIWINSDMHRWEKDWQKVNEGPASGL